MLLSFFTPYTISIHKALTGLDFTRHEYLHNYENFNPQGPHGPRRSIFVFDISSIPISIHKALTGLDSNYCFFRYILLLFQSTRPSRASTEGNTSSNLSDRFQSTRPSRASTRYTPQWQEVNIFQSTRPSRASTTPLYTGTCTVIFQSTRPSRASTLHAIFHFSY